eukprot:jgi/Mesvir1/284/Mv13615-RA.1
MATVRLVQGRAAVLGYSLRPGEDVLLASASCLSAPVTVEPVLPGDDDGNLGADGDQDNAGNGGSASGDCGRDGANPVLSAFPGGRPGGRGFADASIILEVDGPGIYGSTRQSVLVRESGDRGAKSPAVAVVGACSNQGDTGGVRDSDMGVAGDARVTDASKAGKGGATTAANVVEGRHFKLFVKPVSECKGRFILSPAWRSAVDQIMQVLSRPPPGTPLYHGEPPPFYPQLDGGQALQGRHPGGAARFEERHLQSSRWPASSMEDGAGSFPPLRSLAICGPKNAGKSTFARLTINRLLSRFPVVAFLDTDLGQPEFTPPGLVSLHLLDQPVFGPPAMHLRAPYCSYFIGDISPKTDPEKYIRCVCALFDQYKAYASAAYFGHAGHAWGHGPAAIPSLHAPGGMHRGGPAFASGATAGTVPLVVNTHGWVKGVGYELLIEALRYFCPSVVIQLESSAIGRNLPAEDGRFWELPGGAASGAHAASLLGDNAGSVVIKLPAATAMEEDSTTAPPCAATSAQEARAYQWLAYFERGWRAVQSGLLLPSVTLQAAFSLGATALACLPPYAVSLGAVRVVSLYGELDGPELLVALNGALVGLASSSVAQQQAGASIGAPLPPPCLGQALVRSIDAREQVLYLICPLSPDQLQAVDVILLGRLETPAQLLKGDLCLSPYLSQDCLSQAGSGSATMKSRNNLQFRYKSSIRN